MQAGAVPVRTVRGGRLPRRGARAEPVERRRDREPPADDRRAHVVRWHARLRQGARGPGRAAGGAGARRDRERRAGVEPVRAERPLARRSAPRLQAALARGAAHRDRRRTRGLARPAARARRRLQHHPVRPRQRGSRHRRRPLDARLPGGAGGVLRPRVGGRARRGAPAAARGLHVLGLPAPQVPAERGDPDRLRARILRPRRRGHGRLDPPERAQGRAAQRPRPGGRRPGPRRRPRRTTTCR